MITKALTDNKIQLQITDTIRAAFRTKLWRMCQLFTRLGTNNQSTQIQKWIQSDWCLTVNESEVAHQVLCRKRESEQLDTETRK